jgi:hypothetical protein
MNLDVTTVLENWPFRHDEVSARRILGDDGKTKIQLRLDLGLLQMEADGRPDGRRPFGFESYVAYHLKRLETHTERKGTDEGFALTGEECEDLRREAIQYYHRYVAFSSLNDYESLVRDTSRNLQVLDLLWSYAPDDEKWPTEQFRPALIMMNTRGKVLLSLDAKDITAALLQIRSGIQALEDFFRKHGRGEMMAQCQEIIALRKWATEISEKRPLTVKERLEKELAEAVRRENYELAAQLRDQIRGAGREEYHDGPALPER